MPQRRNKQKAPKFSSSTFEILQYRYYISKQTQTITPFLPLFEL